MAGHIEPRNGRYRARFKPPGGKELSKTYDRRGDAKDWLATQESDWARGVWIDPRGGQTRFGDHARQFLSDRVHVRETTDRIDLQNLRLHILPTFESRPLRTITRRNVQSWVASLSKAGLAPNTVRSIYSTFKKVLRAAVLDKLIAESPCIEIDLPEVIGKLTIPTRRQLAIVEGRLPACWRRAVPVAAGTGMRGGELFGLTADRIDFLGRKIVVDRQRQRLPKLQASLDEHGRLPKGAKATPLGHGWFLVPPKSRRSNREIPVGTHTLNTLAAQIAEFPPDEGVGLVFRSGTGRPVSGSGLGDAWETATRRRLAPDPGRPDPGEKDRARDPELAPYFTLHDARHFYASLLIAKGLSVVRVAECLGDSPEVVLRTYAHLWPSDDHAVRAAVDEELDAGDTPVEAITASARPGS